MDSESCSTDIYDEKDWDYFASDEPESFPRPSDMRCTGIMRALKPRDQKGGHMEYPSGFV